MLIDYTPMKKAARDWSICVVCPHMKDTYWLAVNYGLSSEVKRQGAQMRLYEAGGYDNLPLQIKRGHILCAPTDSPVIQGRIAVDQMVCILCLPSASLFRLL